MHLAMVTRIWSLPLRLGEPKFMIYECSTVQDCIHRWKEKQQRLMKSSKCELMELADWIIRRTCRAESHPMWLPSFSSNCTMSVLVHENGISKIFTTSTSKDILPWVSRRYIFIIYMYILYIHGTVTQNHIMYCNFYLNYVRGSKKAGVSIH